MDDQLKKFLQGVGLGDLAAGLTSELPDDLIRELKEVFADFGGADEVLAGKMPPAPPPRPNPAFAVPDPPITPGHLRYDCSDEKDGSVEPVPPIEVSTRADVLEGTPAWRIELRLDDNGIPLEEDVVVRAADLRLMLHEGRVPMASFRTAVWGEYMYPRVRPRGAANTARVPLPETAFVTLTSLWTALAAAPLERGWSAGVHLFQKLADDDWRFLPLSLDVTGEDRVRTPFGVFDCWIVAARGTVGSRTVNDRYWVSRGDPAVRVVVQGHEGRRDGSTRRYQLTHLRRAPTPSEAPSATASASFKLQPRASYERPLERILMKRGGTGRFSADRIEELLAKSMERVPTIESLRAAGKVPPGTPAEAVARYVRERAEYEEDMRAKLELTNVWNDHNERRRTLTAIVRVESEEPRSTFVRLSVPSRVAIDLPGDGYHVDNIDSPVPLSAPLDRTRKRFVARVHATRERFEGQYPSEKFVGPDGSNVVVFGPVPVSRTSWMAFDLTFAFANWDDVAPFTLAYDIAPEGLAAVSGSVLVEVHALEWKPQ